MHQHHQQQPNHNGHPAVPLSAVTSEEIQKYLDENKNLIFAIIENQNLGKITESAQYQAILQKNLTYLAAVADAQPPPSTATSQPPNAAAQQANYIQQAGPAQQQLVVPGPKLPFQLNAHPSQEPQYLHFQQQQQQQQQLQGQISLGGANGMHPIMHPGIGGLGSLMDMHGTKQGTFNAGSTDGQGKSAPGHTSGGGN